MSHCSVYLPVLTVSPKAFGKTKELLQNAKTFNDLYKVRKYSYILSFLNDKNPVNTIILRNVPVQSRMRYIV